MQVKEHHHEHEEGKTDGVHLDGTEYDEHVWTSPVNAQLLVENICGHADLSGSRQKRDL